MTHLLKILLILVLAGAAFYAMQLYNGKGESQKDAAPPLLLINDKDGDGPLPKRFRSMEDTLSSMSLPATGLETLHASGSGTFSKEQLEAVKEKLPGKRVVVVDLRQESHGFINGEPVSWYSAANAANQNKTQKEIQQDEAKKLSDINASTDVEVATVRSKEGGVITDYSPIPVAVETVQTEEELVHSLGFDYQRFTIRDHATPSDSQVDGYITLIRDLPEDSWLHVHCKGGKGRTTTFLAVYDMMKNAKQVSLEDIIARQAALGGSDLFKAKEEVDSYKRKDAEDRRKFLEHFYRYAKENNDGFKTLWTDWLKQNKPNS